MDKFGRGSGGTCTVAETGVSATNVHHHFQTTEGLKRTPVSLMGGAELITLKSTAVIDRQLCLESTRMLTLKITMSSSTVSWAIQTRNHNTGVDWLNSTPGTNDAPVASHAFQAFPYANPDPQGLSRTTKYSRAKAKTCSNENVKAFVILH